MNKSLTLGALALGSALMLSGCGGIASSLLSTGNTNDQIEAITIARGFRVYQGIAVSVIGTLQNGPNASLQYDGNLYYYKSSVSGSVTTISYYVDAAGSMPVGTVTVTNTTAPSITTLSYSAVFAITSAYEASTRPETGTLTITIGSGGSPISTQGTINLNSLSGTLAETLLITNTNGTLSGTISTTGGVSGTSVSLTSISGTLASNVYSVSGSGTILASPDTFSNTLYANGSGQVTLSDGTSLVYNSNGSGTLTISGVSGTTSITNVDNGQ